MTRVAITGGTGFVGQHLTTRLRAVGDDVVVLSRRTGFDLAAPDVGALTMALHGCDAVVHCAGINREIGAQTYDAVHIRGTRTLIEAAQTAKVGHSRAPGGRRRCHPDPRGGRPRRRSIA